MSLTCTACGAANAAGSKFCGQCAEPLVTPGDLKGGSNAGFGVLGGFLMVGLVVFLVFTIGSSDVKGEIRSQGQPFGSYVLVPKECHSGEHESFFGVWVTPPMVKSGGREGFKGGLKLVKTHLGTWTVYVESPLECKGLECAIRELDRAHCQRFDVNVRNTNTVVNDIRVREGHVRLDCKLPEGGTLKANVEFDGCS
jgi:hypothetical protein